MSANDVDDVARVMASRGGRLEERLKHAERALERAPVFLLAQEMNGEVIGWSGAVRHPLQTGLEPAWLISGLTVLPEWRRHGIGLSLLERVIDAVARISNEPLHSVINSRNTASITLHTRAGFTEVDNGTTFAGITFTGGAGVLLSRQGPNRKYNPR